MNKLKQPLQKSAITTLPINSFNHWTADFEDNTNSLHAVLMVIQHPHYTSNSTIQVQAFTTTHHNTAETMPSNQITH
eukprot:gene3224-2206_t